MQKRISFPLLVLFLKSDGYWRLAFACFLCSFFLPVGVGAVRGVFYLMIVLPAFLVMDSLGLKALCRIPVFIFLVLFVLFSVLGVKDPCSVLDAF